MEIIDKQNLIPDQKILERIIKNHPFNINLNENLYSLISKLIIRLKPPSPYSETEDIDFDINKKVALLSIFQETPLKDKYEFILYHEFSHVADKLNPKFKYHDKKKDSLTPTEKECVMELWNVFIDSRLNKEKLFNLGNNPGRGYSSIYGFLTLDLNGELRMRETFLLSRGIRNAKKIIEKIWNNPNHFLSYEEMIEIIKKNSA